MKKEIYKKDFIDNSQFGIANPETFGGYIPENKHGIDDPVKDLNINDQQGFGLVDFDSDNVTQQQTYILQDESGIITLQDKILTAGRIPFVNADGLLTDSANFTTETIGTGSDRVDDGFFLRLNVGASGGLQFQALGNRNIFIVQNRIDFNDNGNLAKISLIGATIPSGIDQTITLPAATGTVALQTAASGTFTTVDLKTVTVVNGLITSIV